VGPSNDHELEIARIVDRIDSEGELCLSSGAGVMAVVDFMMSKADCKFLVGYIRWRMDNPIPK
jgi:hypothetical protein